MSPYGAQDVYLGGDWISSQENGTQSFLIIHHTDKSKSRSRQYYNFDVINIEWCLNHITHREYEENFGIYNNVMSVTITTTNNNTDTFVSCTKGDTTICDNLNKMVTNK
jgi:hypothetical protein